MTNSPNAMPGAFNFHTNRETAPPPRLSGAKSHIFQPPKASSTSASSSLLLTRSTTSVMSLSTNGAGQTRYAAKKRTLEEYTSGTETPRNGDYDYGGMDETVEGWTPGSPQPFVNTRYQLAGGMDTPGFAQAEEQPYGGVEYRRSLSDEAEHPQTRRTLFGEEGSSYFPDSFGRESNGRGRYSQGYSDSPGNGWSKTAIQVAGAVVGKVWEFCKNSGAVFRGFQAGGGTGYKIDPASEDAQFEAVDNWQEKHGLGIHRDSTPLPGEYPPEDLEFIPNYMDNPTPEPTPPRPAKRRQISANYTTATKPEEIAKNWVVVPPSPSPTKSAPKPQPRIAGRFSMPTASSASRRSIASPSTHRPASRAGFGAPNGQLRRPPLITQASRVSHAGSPALNGSRGASYASPRSPVTTPGSRIPRATPSSPSGHARNGSTSTVDSPAAKEAKKWAALKRKEEREADESIRRLDAQLKAMIREGKEALGTKIEVEIEDDLDLNYPSKPAPRPLPGKKWAF